MNENLIHTENQSNVRNKILRFYGNNKVLIFSFLAFFIVFAVIFTFYIETNEKKKKIITENYITAKIYLENNERDKAKNILKEIVFTNNSTYSTLSFFLLLNEDLISDKNEKINLFEYVLNNNRFDKETKNLIIFKKALFESNFVNESDLLMSLKPLINEDTIWKPHALLLLGDFFYSKKEFQKAKEFYSQILLQKNINQQFYNQARIQLALMLND